jgi:hypothetical protein
VKRWRRQYYEARLLVLEYALPMYSRVESSVECRLYLDKALANHGLLADVAEEALVVPGQGLESHKLGAAQASLACVPPAHIFFA